MQLVAYGAQDVYLTGNPQITFFKVMYRRHTHFSLESIEQTFNGAVNFGKKVTCTISRNGDLIHRMYLRVELPGLKDNLAGDSEGRWVDYLGHALIKTIDVEIGGQRIDRQYGEWMHVWNELTQTSGHQMGYNTMIGMHPALTTPLAAAPLDETKPYIMYIPLQFWFCRNPGLALPLIALQYHEIKINFEFREIRDLIITAPGKDVIVQGDMNASLFVDYIFMDTDERRRFAQVTHEYLIEQVQFSGAESVPDNATTVPSNVKTKLQLNHPCKELIFFVSDQDNVTSKNWFDYSTGTPGAPLPFTLPPAGGNNGFVATGKNGKINPVLTCRLQLNGHDRFSDRDGMYFNVVQPYQHHENVPSTGINVYSFALKPEDHQPSGTCNMSRIDNATLQMTLSPMANGSLIYVFATNYNVLRIMSGMGGLAYSS